MNHPNYEYLELACYGMSYEEIAKRYNRSVSSVRHATIRAARKIGCMGFWKFYVLNYDWLTNQRKEILARMDRYGILRGHKE